MKIIPKAGDFFASRANSVYNSLRTGMGIEMLQNQCYAQHRQLELPPDPINLTSHMAKGEGLKPHTPTIRTENRVKTAQESLLEIKNHYIC